MWFFFGFFQGAYSYVYFVNVLWPDFSLWNFICSIFYYQHFVRTSQNHHKMESKAVSEFVSRVQESRLNEIVNLCECAGQPFDWKKLNSMSPDELFEYYSEHL